MGGNGYNFTATQATRNAIWLRAGLCGAGGSGKSYSAMAIADAFTKRLNLGPFYVIDSENGSALRYAPSPKTGCGFNFQHVPMPIDDYSPHAYMAALDFCEAKGAGVIVIDSISHEYDGPGGIMEIVDRNTNGNDKFAGWRVATPLHKRFLQRINSVNAHTIWTVRAKTAYTSKKDERTGKTKFEKEGLGPVQREGIEYEPDIFVWMADAVATVDKTRCDYIGPGSVWDHPGAEFAGALADWIEDVVPESALPDPAEAISVAVTEGVAAAESKDPDRYKRAKAGLLRWCLDHRLGARDGEEVLAQFRDRVAAMVGPKVSTTPDEDRLRAIDQGRSA